MVAFGLPFRSKSRQPSKPQVPEGHRVYAVGDIHGRLDLLDELLDKIDHDTARLPPALQTLVFVGDYIDRGPDSYLVLSRLLEIRSNYRAICLKGNHEALLAQFLRDPSILKDWGPLGGTTTLMSYGLVPAVNATGEESVALAAELGRVMPDVHRRFLDALPIFFELGDYFFVHAGVRPKVPLKDQSEHDMLWIREDFMLYEGKHEKIIVHGHTPVLVPDLRPNRINIDTGAYATGKLSCLVLEGDDQRFL